MGFRNRLLAPRQRVFEYAARRDPVSGLPFTYVRGESPSTASLSMPDIPGVPDDSQQRRTYKIEMVSP